MTTAIPLALNVNARRVVPTPPLSSVAVAVTMYVPAELGAKA